MMTSKDEINFGVVKENMKKHDKFIGDILAPFEKVLGMKFNNFDKPEDPKYVEPKKKGNLKRKLKEAERKQEKLKKLDPEAAKKVQWQKVMDKARGIKVKDDPKMIRKALKRKEAEKKKHKKKWAERTQKLEEAKKIRQKKRKERIKKAKSKEKKKSNKK
jgi:hypothetical protein